MASSRRFFQGRTRLVDTLKECVEDSLALPEIQDYLKTHSLEDATGKILSITLEEMEKSPLCRAIKGDVARGLQKACARIIKEETAQAALTDIISTFLEIFARPKE